MSAGEQEFKGNRRFGQLRDVRVELLTDMLGTVPKDPDVYATYIATKAPKPEDGEEEVSTVSEQQEEQNKAEAKGWTGFHSDENGIFMYNYMIKGFLKTAQETLQDLGEKNGGVKKLPAYKKWIDRTIFIYPRRIYFGQEEADPALARPLRTMTAKGERTTVARSDTVKAGKVLEFQIEILLNTKGLNWDHLAILLDYGAYIGFGQWRGSGGYGQFKLLGITEPK